VSDAAACVFLSKKQAMDRIYRMNRIKTPE